MAENQDLKVVLKQKHLRGANQAGGLQRVAFVYLNGREYRVSAPPEAEGEAIDWVRHFTVRQLVDINSEEDVGGALGVLAIRAVQEELEKERRDVARSKGMHPDGLHAAAQICLKGHIQHCDGMPFDSKTHCPKCGEACIDACPRCNEAIRGIGTHQHKTDYVLPQYCHGCGRPYPWMDEKLRTARELLDYDDKLTFDEKKSLWDDLQYVMSDPKADLVPAKRKLIDLKLGRATDFVKETFTEFLAKVTAEYLARKS